MSIQRVEQIIFAMVIIEGSYKHPEKDTIW
jgi:hypothetical protein